MRWEILFDDLQSRVDAAERDGLAEELADLIEAEAASITLVERLRAAHGVALRVLTRDGEHHHGVVADCGDGWVLLQDGRRQVLVPVAAISWVTPLAGAAPPAGLVSSRLGLAHALRALVRARQVVQVCVLGSRPVRGVLTRVGADHVDLLPDGRDLAAISVPLVALTAVMTV